VEKIASGFDYSPANVISITDGQLFLETDPFYQGTARRSFGGLHEEAEQKGGERNGRSELLYTGIIFTGTIVTRRSVSRAGSATQTKAIRKAVYGTTKLGSFKCWKFALHS